MKKRLLLFLVALSIASALQAADPLPSWNEGKARQSIVDFVSKVTKQGGPHSAAGRWWI